MFRIEMLPAAHGDALWVEYGPPDAPTRILIDGGPAHTYEALRERVLHLPRDERHFELLIVTHVDADHIDGIVMLLQDELGCTFGDVWFNGWNHLYPLTTTTSPPLGPMQGAFLDALIGEVGLPLNKAWEHGPIFVGAEGEPPVRTLEGGMKITLLSPNLERLLLLRDEWQDVIRDAGFSPGDQEAALRQLRLRKYNYLRPDDSLGSGEGMGNDNSIANGSSIAFLAEYEGKRVLLAGDAFPEVLLDALQRIPGAAAEGHVDIDAFKLPHHGSKSNLKPELLDFLRCKNYLVSTSGALFDHPDHEAIELVREHHGARGYPRLHFNHRSKTTAPWESPTRTDKYYSFYPGGTSLDLR